MASSDASLTIELDMLRPQPRSAADDVLEDDIHPPGRENVRVRPAVFSVMRVLGAFGGEQDLNAFEGAVRQLLIFAAVILSILNPPREPLFEWWVPMVAVTSYALWTLRGATPRRIVSSIIRRAAEEGADEKENRRTKLLLNTVSFHSLLPAEHRKIYPIIKWPLVLLGGAFATSMVAQGWSRAVQWKAEGGGVVEAVAIAVEQLGYAQVMGVNFSALCFLLYLMSQLQTEVRSLYMEAKLGLFESAEDYIKHHSSITKRVVKQYAQMAPLILVVVSANLMRVIQSGMVMYIFGDGWALLPMIVHTAVALSPALAAAEVNAWTDSIMAAAYRRGKYSGESLQMMQAYESVNPLSIYIFGIRFTYSWFLSIATSILSIGVPTIYATMRNSMPSFIEVLKERYGKSS